ncbi:MAG: carbohydrate-binding domain-containing protein, partial [Prevotellaceae bacterium]|nr:carbohydrate-binding domain-containing protein [Prevotellaceae bacterium]
MTKTISNTTKTRKGFCFGRRMLRSAILCLLLLAGGTGARAQTTYNINSGSVNITTGGTYTINGTGAATTNCITVSSGVVADITLNNVNIDVNTISGACAFDMTGATVNLTLTGDNILKSGDYKAGLQVTVGAILAIDGTGSLTANGGNFGAGIGGGNGSDGGSITINGGTVTATGKWGAGIGGGYTGSGGNISISGGTVMANGGYGGAGIGGGYTGSGGNISISGGTVTATGGIYAAGIGGGSSGTGGSITISGGTVTATGSIYAAGIGGGDGGSGGSISISGGTIKATGSNTGIGYGQYGNGGTLKITGGSINASTNLQPTNGSGGSVYLNTLTVGIPAIADSTIITAGNIGGTACVDGTPTPPAYGIHDVVTDGEGKVYFWLPVSANNGGTAEKVILTADNNNYTNTFARPAFPTSATLNPIDMLVTSSDKNIADPSVYTFAGNVHTIKANGTYTITGTTTVERIVVNSGVAANITLINVNIVVNVSNNDASPIRILQNANVILNLVGTNILTSGSGRAAGLQVDDATLTINGPGSLTATGTANNSAGIGERWDGSKKRTIIINGGTITAKGHSYGSGIGGVGTGGEGSITINGGTITASSTEGAGIGCDGTSAVAIIINGGSINASCTNRPALGTTPKNSDGDNVYLNTLTVGNPSVNDTDIDAGSIGGTNCDATAYTVQNPTLTGYGINDVKTDGSGKVYFYLPESTGSELVALTASGTEYRKYYKRNTNNNNQILTPQEEHSIALSQEGTYTFPTASYGYGTQLPLTVTVTNTGYGYTGDLTVGLSGTNGNDFTLSSIAINSIAVGAEATFTVAPKTGIAGGIRVATVTVSDGNGISEEFEVRFTVISNETIININTGTSIPSGYPSGTGWRFEDSRLIISNGANVTVRGTSSNNRRIQIAANATAQVTLDGVNIDVTGCAFYINDGATAYLTLVGTNTLRSNGGNAGLRVSGNTWLTVTEESTGSVTVHSDGSAAGIGGARSESGGYITINGGTVTAYGSSGQGSNAGAGIGGGGGNGGGWGGNGGNITINGGAVTAYGSNNGDIGSAAIGGGGNHGNSGNIIINGGTVRAYSSNSGAGIGAAGLGYVNNITINGGVVVANGAGAGAGIGAGGSSGYSTWGENGGNIIINGGTVTANADGSSAAIGGAGNNKKNGNLTINGGSVKMNNNNGIVPKNSLSATVYLNTLTVGNPSVNNTAITAGSISGTPCDPTAYTAQNSTPTGYGINGVKTDGSGKVYFWLPQSSGDEWVELEANSAYYGNNYKRNEDNSNNQVLTLKYAITLSETGTHTFPDSIYGYSALTPLTVTVNNVGYMPTGGLTVALSGAGSSNFTLSGNSISDIAASDNTTFTVVPQTGLAVGTYTETLTVSGSNGISEEFEVSFEVTKATLTITPNTGQSKVYGGSDPTFSFSVLGWQNSDQADSASIITGALSRVSGEDVGQY